MASKIKLTAKTGSSTVVTRCQVCDSKELDPILFVGYLPPVNEMKMIGSQPKEEPGYPAQLLFCRHCHLAQLGLIVDPHVLFPPEYPYTSGTTKILRENFSELAENCRQILPMKPEDLVVDIGSNDGTLLSNFSANHRVYGIEPSDRGKLAIARKIPTLIEFFGKASVDKVIKKAGKASVITATNVFAHIENIHDIVKNILRLLDKNGVFISESHYLLPLVETLQYDTIYHEHLRYYSLESLSYLLKMHGLDVFYAKRIPTHGGSIRVFAARKGVHQIDASVKRLLDEEKKFGLDTDSLRAFGRRVVKSKLELYALLNQLKANEKRVVGIGAPSRASTLINYVGLDEGILESVLETKGSFKVGKYMPGKLIPVYDEDVMYKDQPDYALLLSWHIADELMPKIKAKGFRGHFIVPLPAPRIVQNADV